jgi:hypothetical protein
MSGPAEEQEWRSLIERLHDGIPEPLPEGLTPGFDDASARNRVGVLITKAVLGENLYELYRLYCGDPPLPG